MMLQEEMCFGRLTTCTKLCGSVKIVITCHKTIINEKEPEISWLGMVGGWFQSSSLACHYWKIFLLCIWL